MFEAYEGILKRSTTQGRRPSRRHPCFLCTGRGNVLVRAELSMTDDQLMADFEAGRVPEGGFHHREHIRVAWNYLRVHTLPDALARFCAGLRQFAAAQGVPGLYHETITVAYILLI